MKVILWMAISVNGIIARENGEEDFLSHDNWIEFAKKTNQVGSLVWGRKTYQAVRTWDKQYLEDLKKVRKIILSKKPNLELEEGFTQAHSPKEALEILSKEGFKEVVLTGGSNNNSSFVKEGLIDEIILNVEPVIIGKGLPLFAPENFDLKLKLLKVSKLENNLFQLHYKVY